MVDWRTSVVEYLRTLPQPSTPLDHDLFAQEWRQGYYEAMANFSSSPETSTFKTVDEHHMTILRALVKKNKLETVWGESLLRDINLVWHRLHGWSDSTKGLHLLKSKFIIGTLSNGNVRLLVDMAKFARLPWDVIFSGDLLKAYKPQGEMYLGACGFLQLPPDKVGMVFRTRITLTLGGCSFGRFKSSKEFWFEDNLCKA